MGGGMGHETNWLPPLLVLGIGLAVGLVLAIAFARSKRAAAQAARAAVAHEDVEVRDLRVQREQFLAQLRELDDTAGKRTPDELARHRWELELHAAAVLRDLDGAEAKAQAVTRAAAPAAAAAAAAAPSPRAAWVGAAWGAGVVLFGAVLFFVLQNNSGNRAPGGSVTGNGPTVNGGAPMAAAEEEKPDPELEQFMARAQANPQNLEAQLDLAQAFLYRERLIDVFQVVQHIRTIDAENPRALTYEAVVRQAMGLGEQALQLLDKAVEKDPKLAEAWVRRGLVAFEVGRYDVAVVSWEKALEIRPDGQEALAPVIAEAKLRRENQGKVAPVPSLEEMAAAPAPAPAAAPVPAPAPAGGPDDLQVVLDLDPALAGKIAPGTPIFVSVRPAGVKMGPPVAAKRLAAGSFPVSLAIGAGDSMMGQPLPNPAYIEARIDGDGNAMTRDPADPTGSADGVAAGKATTVVLRAGN